MATILELSSKKALEYFMQSSNYCTISFPIYFDFETILSFIKAKIGSKDFGNCLKDVKKYPSDYDNVSYHLLMNKDGRYAYRPLQLVNPYLYYFLAREITKNKNWTFIKKRFKEFENPNFEIVSIPHTKDAKDKGVMATTIKSWWEHIEQRSIELSLEYKYLFITDITNCYGSIYTHSISWALHGVDYAKNNREEKNLGKSIDNYIMGMQYGQTNGIPQGSVLFDFIAEIILGYADSLLYDDLKRSNINVYKILRYRDDYRIFSNSKEEIEIIAMKLQAILTTLNLQINSSKTKLCEDVVEASIKEDKLYYIANVPAYKGVDTLFNTFQQELLFILQFSKIYPNSGTLSKLLNKFLKRLTLTGKLNENVNVLSAIIVEIAMNSPKIYNHAVAILSNLITKLDTSDERENILNNILHKFSQLPNIGYLQIWMQRITYKMNTINRYTEPLCKIVNNESLVSIWNNNWLKDELIADFPTHSMCTNWLVDFYTPIINIDEVSIFDY